MYSVVLFIDHAVAEFISECKQECETVDLTVTTNLGKAKVI